MTKNHTRKYLQLQGFDLDDDALAEIGPWMRWPYVFCASFLVTGVVLASPWIVWALATVATATVFLPSHPFSYAYNYGVRHWTGTRPLPPSTPQGRFACGMGAIFLIAIGTAFYIGATTIGYVLGGALSSVAALVATTHVCVPSIIYNAIFGMKTAESVRPSA